MPALISLDEAFARVAAVAAPALPEESVPLADCLGRSLAAAHHAEGPWPTTDRSAMDGFAVRAGATGLAAGTALEVVGVCLAGHPFTQAVQDGQAIRIMTGAVVPQSVDAVVPVENTSGYAEVGEQVSLAQPVQAGDNIRPLGSEVAAGAQLLAPGTRLGPAEIGSLAVLGVDPVACHRRPVVAVLATGDEVVPIDAVPAPHQVRNSNAHALAAQVRAAGAVPLDLGIAGDAPEALRAAMQRGLGEADVLLTIGGVSKGTHDLVHGILAELQVAEQFHGVALKPGKPVYFGRRQPLGEAGPRYVFGLPGNPASTFTCFDLFVRPLLAAMGGAPARHEFLQARVAGQPFRKNWRAQAVPCRLRSETGELIAELGSSKVSGDPFGLMQGDAYALIPGDTDPDPELRVPVLYYAHRA